MKKTFLLTALGCLLFHGAAIAQLTWQRMPGPPGDYAFGSIATGSGGKWLLRSGSIGVHESGDGGQTWRWNALPESIHTEAALHVGTDGQLWFFEYETLTVSTDNGRTWTEIMDEGSVWIANDLAASLLLDGGAVMLGARGTGIVRSTDSSRTLAPVLTVPGGINAFSRNPATGHLFAWKSTGTAGQINKIYRSTDAGLTWNVWENDPLTTGKNLLGIRFAPNGSAFLVTNQKLLRSTDDGATWAELTMRAGELAITPTGRLFTEDLDGLFTHTSKYSDDNGDTWQNLAINRMAKFSAMPDGTIFAEYYFHGLYRSTDNGQTWQYSAYGIAHHLDAPRLHFYADGAISAITQDGAFYSANGATDWVQHYTTIGDEQFYPNLNTAFLPNDAAFMVTNGKLLRSIDRGSTWADISPAALNADDFQTLRQASGVLFLNLYDNNSFTLRSADGGDTWTNIGNLNLGSPISVGTNGTFWGHNGSNLFKSTDQGQTWAAVTTPALSFSTHIFPLPNGHILLLGGSKILRSTNGGASWTTTTNNYMTNVTAAFANSAGQLFVMGQQFGSTGTLVTSVDEGQTWQTTQDPDSYWADDFVFQAPDERLWFLSGDGAWRSNEPSNDFLTLGGFVRNDLNQNCAAVFAEPALPNFLVKTVAASGQIAYGMTDATGHYRALARGGTYEISAVVPNDLWETCSVTATIPTNITSGNFNAPTLPVKPAVLCPRLEIDVAAPLLRRCFDTRLAVRYRNSGTQAATNAQARIVLDPFLDLLGSSYPIAQQSGDTLWFDLGTVTVNESGTFYLDVNVSCEANLGQMHCTEARITPDSLCSDWASAVLRTDLTCLGDSILVKIQNTGQNAMISSQKWQIWRQIATNFDSLLVAEGNFSLAAGAVFSQKIAASGDAQLLLRVPQEPGYPFGSGYAQTFLLNCDGGNAAPYSYSPTESVPGRELFCLRNIGSFDPNDKTGFPEGIGTGHHIEKTEPLSYLIRFQNTGTDTAFTVVIRDTLSPLLDLETLQLGAASHPVQMNVRGENELVFRFDNILLPDSNINAAASQGFVRYAIRQKPNNPDGAVIRNRAGIYFDFNLPVMTNETWHTVGLPVVSGLVLVGNEPFRLYCSPNPVSEGQSLQVSLENDFFGTVKIEILSLDGQVLETFFEEKTSHEVTWIHPVTMAPASFFVRVSDGKRSATRLIFKF
jgi:photosystem II stability/assembly factor-like uncharacterized protein